MKKITKVSLLMLVVILLSCCAPSSLAVGITVPDNVKSTSTATMVPTNTPTVTSTPTKIVTPTETTTATVTSIPTEVPVATLAYEFEQYDWKLAVMSASDLIVGTPDPNVVPIPNYKETDFGKSLQLFTQKFYGGKALFTSPCTSLCYEVTGECFQNPFIVWDSQRPQLEDQCYQAFPNENVKGPVKHVIVIMIRTYLNKSVKIPQAVVLRSYQNIPVDFSDGVNYEELIEFEQWSKISNQWNLYNIDKDGRGKSLKGSMEFVYDIIPLSKMQYDAIIEYMKTDTPNVKVTYDGVAHYYVSAYPSWTIPFQLDETKYVARP